MESDTLFHCQICPYSICHSCYQRHRITSSSKQLDTLFIILEGYHFPNTLPPAFTAVYQYCQSLLIHHCLYPSVNLQVIWDILSHIFTATKACIECWFQPAQVTFVHAQWNATLNGHLLPTMCTTCTANRTTVPLVQSAIWTSSRQRHLNDVYDQIYI